MTSRFVLPFADIGSGIAPSDGAKLTFKNPGLETLKNTFSDSTGLTPNANPVVSDATGLFSNIYINGSYDVVLQDKNNVQIWADSVSEFATKTDTTIVKNFATLALAVADTNLIDDDALNIAERTTGNSGGAMWDVVLSSTVTENTFNIVQGVGIFSLVLRTKTGEVNVKEFGAAGNNTNDDTAAIQAAIDFVGDFGEVFFPVGEYLVTATIDCLLTLGLTLRGVRRSSRIMFNHNSALGFDFDNVGPSSTGRATNLINMAFYSSFTNSAIPDEAVVLTFCPESVISSCTFIECATVSQLRMKDSWSSLVHNQNFFSVDEPGLTPTYGSPSNSTSAGVGLYIDTNTHAVTVHQNRIRTGNPSMRFNGGDASEIKGNQIEGGKAAGLIISNATSTLRIENNYFEGGNNQKNDILYTSAATNFGHTIASNYFNADTGVEIEDNCECNGLAIKNNNFLQQTGIKLGSGIGFSGIRITDNNFRNIITPYDIPAASFKTIGLSYPDNIMKLNNTTIGTSPDSPGTFSTSIYSAGAIWSTSSGTGAASDASINHNGVLMYDLAGTTSYVAVVDFPFDISMKDDFITVNIPFITPAGTNIIVSIDDGVTTKSFTCSSNAAGSAAIDNVFYHRLAATADKIRIRATVGTSLTIQTLTPTVRRGLHDDLVYSDIR